jgi:hypothetical protein
MRKREVIDARRERDRRGPVLNTHSREPSDAVRHESNVHPTNQQNKRVHQSTPTWTLSPGVCGGYAAVAIWWGVTGRHGHEFNLGLKIAVRQGHRTPKGGTMLRGAVLHCQFEREAKGGPPQRWWWLHQALPDAWVQRNESRGLVQLLRISTMVQQAEQFGTGRRTVLLLQ